MSDLKTSKEILDNYFKEMAQRDDLHKPTVAALVDLYGKNKLTKTNVANALEEAREKSEQDEN